MSYQDNYRLIEWTMLPEVRRKPAVAIARSDLPCPRIASDIMAPVQSMLDGKLYDSKSALRRTYRAANCIEVGNDPARLKPRDRTKKKPADKAIKDTVDRAEARFNRGERSR